MRTSETGIALIKRFEGFRAEAYRCPAGHLTIGYGHVVRTGEPLEKISEAQAEALLAEDLIISEAAVQRLVPLRLAQWQFDAMVSFTYNLGAGALQRSTLRRLILRGDHALAAREFNRWVYAGGKRLSGLIIRRKAEMMLYLGEI